MSIKEKDKCPYCGELRELGNIDGVKEIFCDCEIDREI